jgi:nucleoside 2-deoxyribosyltransferase
MKIYMAGPLFTTAEKHFNHGLAAALREFGHEVWLPQDMEPRDRSARSVFEKDVEGIDQSEAIVACMDGPDPDSGTAWECGYGYAKGKKIILYRTDERGISDGGLCEFNLMLYASANSVLDGCGLEIGELAEATDKLLKMRV